MLPSLNDLIKKFEDFDDSAKKCPNAHVESPSHIRTTSSNCSKSMSNKSLLHLQHTTEQQQQHHFTSPTLHSSYSSTCFVIPPPTYQELPQITTQEKYHQESIVVGASSLKLLPSPTCITGIGKSFGHYSDLPTIKDSTIFQPPLHTHQYIASDRLNMYNQPTNSCCSPSTSQLGMHQTRSFHHNFSPSTSSDDTIPHHLSSNIISKNISLSNPLNVNNMSHKQSKDLEKFQKRKDKISKKPKETIQFKAFSLSSDNSKIKFINEQHQKIGINDGSWTEKEHKDFIRGLDECGKGKWREIAEGYVKTRTRTQVASHARKYLEMLERKNKYNKE